MDLEYSKQPLTYTQQADLLHSRGLTINNSKEAVKFLKQVNYYRFSAYCIPFQKSPDAFIPGVTFQRVTDLYRLDESLRREVLSLITPVEIFLRTRIIYEFSHGWGTFAHYDSMNFRDNFNHLEWVSFIEEEIVRGREAYLEHYKNTYKGFPRLPLWITCEIISLGSLSLLFQGLIPDIQRKICCGLGIPQFVLVNWLHHITYIRNICAHHNRLWNRELNIKPFIPRKIKAWTELNLDPARIFTSLSILEWIYRKAELPLSDIEPVFEVLNSITALDERFSQWMGIPPNTTAGFCWNH
jgi:abortive infection bacteriophage resistance protein